MSKQVGKQWWLVVALAIGLPSKVGLAEVTRFFELEGLGHFLDGNPESTSVSEDGAIGLPPKVIARYRDDAAVFSAAAVHQGKVVLARLSDSQVMAVDLATGKETTLTRTNPDMVTALASNGQQLLMATSNHAKLYLLDMQGNSTLMYTAEANYIWSIAPADNHAWYCVTGEPAMVLKVAANGNAKVLWQSEQRHLRTLAVSPQGLAVGGGERGVVYYAHDKQHFTAIYDSGAEEITALAFDHNNLYAAAVSGAAALFAEEDKHRGKQQVRSQIVKLQATGESEMLAGSTDEAVLALLPDGNDTLLVATGATGRDEPRGRLYQIMPKNHAIALVYQASSKRLSHLLPGGHGVRAILIAAAGGQVLQVMPQLASSGDFITQVFDTGWLSHFGRVQVLGDYPPHTQVKVALRVGQTAIPDATWPAWSKAVDAKEAASGVALPHVPAGRFVQMRLRLQGGGKLQPQVHRARVAYLRQNLPPLVREISVLPKGVALQAPPSEEAKPIKVISVFEAMRQQELGKENGRARPIKQTGALTIRWAAEDLNGDSLVYTLAAKREGDADWQLLKDHLDETFYTLQASQLADGYYVFRVEASDARSNPMGLERTDRRSSRRVLIDNTAPSIAPLRVSYRGKTVVVQTLIKDKWGPLSELWVSLDHSMAKPVLPEDGLLDGAEESVVLQLHDLSPGAHSITLRAVDAAENEAFADTQVIVKQ